MKLSLIKRKSHKEIKDEVVSTLEFFGLTVYVEFPKSSIRFGKETLCGYGYIRGLDDEKIDGGDGEDLDVYIGDNLESELVFVIKQLRESGEFDEYKVMIGFNSEEEAKVAYLNQMPESFFGGIETADNHLERLLPGFTAQDGEIIDSKVIQDKVVSTVRLFRYDFENDNDRAYSEKSSKRVVKELKAEIDKGLDSEVFDEHAEALYNKDGDLQSYNRYQNEKLADLQDVWIDEEEKSALGKIVWNELSEQGKKLAELAQDKEKRKSIKFSIKAKKDKCYEKNGILYCDFEKLYGIDKVKDPALDDAEILNTEVIKDSKHKHLTDSLVPVSSCGQECPCDDCTSKISINISNLGDNTMAFDAERIKKLHMTVQSPPLVWEQVLPLITGDGWYYTGADVEMAKAYWDEITGTKTGTESPPAEVVTEANTDAEKPPFVKEEGKDKGADTPIPPKKEDEVKDTEAPEETIQKLMDKGLNWDDAKEILSTMVDIDLVAAEAKWKELETAKAEMANKDKTMQDNLNNSNRGDNTVAGNTTPSNNAASGGTPAQVVNPIDQEIRDSFLKEKADREFNSKVEALFEGKELTDSNKADIRKVANEYRPTEGDSTAIAIAKRETSRIINDKKHQDLLDARRAEMGYTQGNGQSATHVPVNGNEMNMARPWREILDKYEGFKEELIAGVKDGVFSGVSGVNIRRARKKELTDTKFFKEVIGGFERQNYQALCDAVSTSEVHGVNTAKQREKLFTAIVLEEQFYLTTMIESVYQALSPASKFNIKPPIVPGSKAKAQNIGGIFILPLKTVSEDAQAKAKHYRPARNVGKIGLINTNFEYNRFPTRTRRGGAIFDDENWVQLMQANGWDVRIENAMDIARALGRSIDDECIEDFVNRVREHNAVNMCAGGTYTPASTEWIANSGATQLYGDEVTYYAVIKGPYTAGTLTVSNPAGVNPPAPLILPLPLPYIDQLTGDLIDDYVPFDIVFTVAGATNDPCLGYQDEDGNPAPYEDSDVVTHFIDEERGIVAFNTASGVGSSTKPVFSEVWYATNYELWSKSQGLISDPFASGTPIRERAEGYLNRNAAIAGEMADERNIYPRINIGRFGFMNSYVNTARTFEKQVSPTGATLSPEHGYGSYLGEKANIKYLKTNNPNFPNSTFMALEGCGFYGLGHVYGVTNDQQVTISGGTGKINAPANGMFRVYGQLDTVGFPRFLDGREFPGYEQRIID